MVNVILNRLQNAMNHRTLINLLGRSVLVMILMGWSFNAWVQTTSAPLPHLDKTVESVTAEVKVQPQSRDKSIAKRIQSILAATGRYDDVNVDVKEGIVFLNGTTKTTEFKAWAGELAKNTQDVVAVVNEMEIIHPSLWNTQQIKRIFNETAEAILNTLPFLGFALLLLAFIFPLARLFSKWTRKSLQARGLHPLLSDVIGRGIALFCILLGLYFILRVVGLTTMAFTVIGGTGVLGIVLGIAFRNITENLLASILLSIQKPFQQGELIEVDGFTGYVQGLTTRATLLMTQSGHEVQIPNATVYKSVIYNFTSNPNYREEFVIGIGYDDAISTAQKIALNVLAQHPAVLKDPEPWVLVFELAPETVNLRVYFWLDASQYHWHKVKSSVIRLIKRAFQEAGISMPGHEILIKTDETTSFPVRLLKEREKTPVSREEKEESSAVATEAEGALSREKDEIEWQAKRSNLVNDTENLLR